MHVRKQLIRGALVLIATLGVCLRPARRRTRARRWTALSTGSNQVLASSTEGSHRGRRPQGERRPVQGARREYQQNLHQLIENSLTQAVQDRMSVRGAPARSPGSVSCRDQARRGDRRRGRRLYEQNKAQIPRPKNQVAARSRPTSSRQGQQKAARDFKTLEQVKVDYKLEPSGLEVAATRPPGVPRAPRLPSSSSRFVPVLLPPAADVARSRRRR